MNYPTLSGQFFSQARSAQHLALSVGQRCAFGFNIRHICYRCHDRGKRNRHGWAGAAAGVTLQLYQAGTTGYGSAATPLGPTVLSDAAGNFSTCQATPAPLALRCIWWAEADSQSLPPRVRLR